MPLAGDYVTKVVPSKMEKQIEENKAKYGKRIKQLSAIIKDESYIPEGSTNTYHEFIFNMYKALIHGRVITPKMVEANLNIVKKYSEHLRKENDYNYQKDKIDYVEESTAKIGMVKRLLKKANYTSLYVDRSMYFLNSVERYLKENKKLSVKQRKALNSMYKRFEKRVNKGIKK